MQKIQYDSRNIKFYAILRRSVNKEPAPASTSSVSPSLYKKGVSREAANPTITTTMQPLSTKTELGRSRGLLNGHFANQESNRQT